MESNDKGPPHQLLWALHV